MILYIYIYICYSCLSRAAAKRRVSERASRIRDAEYVDISEAYLHSTYLHSTYFQKMVTPAKAEEFALSMKNQLDKLDPVVAQNANSRYTVIFILCPSALFGSRFSCSISWQNSG